MKLIYYFNQLPFYYLAAEEDLQYLFSFYFMQDQASYLELRKKFEFATQFEENQKGWIIVGRTRTGKSTLAILLQGKTLNIVQTQDHRYLFQQQKSGHSLEKQKISEGVDSYTEIPNIVPYGDNIVIVDCPGNKDTEYTRRIVNSFYTKQVVFKMKEVHFIVVTSIMSSNLKISENEIKMFKQIKKMFPLSGSYITICVNNLPSGVQEMEVKNRLCEQFMQLDEEEGNITKGLYSFFSVALKQKSLILLEYAQHYKTNEQTEFKLSQQVFNGLAGSKFQPVSQLKYTHADISDAINEGNLEKFCTEFQQLSKKMSLALQLIREDLDLLKSFCSLLLCSIRNNVSKYFLQKQVNIKSKSLQSKPVPTTPRIYPESLKMKKYSSDKQSGSSQLEMVLAMLLEIYKLLENMDLRVNLLASHEPNSLKIEGIREEIIHYFSLISPPMLVLLKTHVLQNTTVKVLKQVNQDLSQNLLIVKHVLEVLEDDTNSRLKQAKELNTFISKEVAQMISNFVASPLHKEVSETEETKADAKELESQLYLQYLRELTSRPQVSNDQSEIDSTIAALNVGVQILPYICNKDKNENLLSELLLLKINLQNRIQHLKYCKIYLQQINPSTFPHICSTIHRCSNEQLKKKIQRKLAFYCLDNDQLQQSLAFFHSINYIQQIRQILLGPGKRVERGVVDNFHVFLSWGDFFYQRDDPMTARMLYDCAHECNIQFQASKEKQTQARISRSTLSSSSSSSLN